MSDGSMAESWGNRHRSSLWRLWRLGGWLVCLCLPPTVAAQGPTPEQAEAALRKAVAFFHGQVARHGGYVWRYSGDLALSEGEGKTGPTTIWVQPPGTPTVGLAYLDAYYATGERACLEAARDAARALVLGQRHSGGWGYSIDFDPVARARESYHLDLDGRPTPDPVRAADRNLPVGWDAWKTRKYRGNISTLDDNTTQAATLFLARIDQALEFRDETIHTAALLALDALCRAQYPNGGWSASFDRFPVASPSPDEYPVKPARYPEDWSRTWPKDFTGCYVTNDNLMADLIDLMLAAEAIYHDRRYLESAERTGRFLVLAQMPDPQPAWAQQYNKEMHPEWSRRFEPPAISGLESQGILLALIQLARRTGKAEYLEPVPKALEYLRRSQLADGRLARFYELKTNRPLYFTRDYQLTYDGRDVPRHYGFVVGARLDVIERAYRQARAGLSRGAAAQPDPEPPLAATRVQALIDGLDDRGAWVERGGVLDAHDLRPESGVIASSTFAANVRTLARFLAQSRGRAAP